MKKIIILFIILIGLFFGSRYYTNYINETKYPSDTLRLISIGRNTTKFEYFDDAENDIYKIINYEDVEALANIFSVSELNYVESKDTIDWTYRITFQYKLLDNLIENGVKLDDKEVELNKEIVVMINDEGILFDGKLYIDNQLYGENKLTTYEMIMNSLDVYYHDDKFGEVIINND